MAIVILNKAELRKIIKNATDEKIDEALSLFGTAVERITNKEVEVEVPPDRPDMLSQQGLFRALRSYQGKNTGLKAYKIKNSGQKLIVEKSLPKEWPYAFACIVKNLKFDDDRIKEVIEIQEKLGSSIMRSRKKGGIGVYPLEKIEFPIRFTGMEPDKIKFRPLEYPQEITGRQILSKHPTGKEYAYICKDWTKFPVFIDNKGTIMSMPPIINSHDVGKIDETTKDVFVEVTGKDSGLLKKALNIIVTSLTEMGGQIYSINCIQQNGKSEDIPNLNPEKLKINIENANKLLGLNFKESEIKKLLERMGYNYKAKEEVEIPAWRADILHENDIIEDIAKAYGYQNFVPELPEIATIGQESEIEIKKRKITEILVGLGLLETSSFHLTTKKEIKKADHTIKNFIEVEDSKTEYNTLRQNLLTNLMKILSENSDAQYPQKIFELGKVFSLDNKEETCIEETEKLAVAISGETNFTEMKQVLEYLMKALALEFKIEEAEHPSFIPGRTGKIILKGREIGFLGEISPNVLKNWHIKMPTVALEIEIEEL